MRSAKGRQSQPKNIAQEFDLSRLCYLCGMKLRHAFSGLGSKVAKILGICLLFVTIFTTACNDNAQNSGDKQAIMLSYSDSLWNQHKVVTSLFRYKLDVIRDRKVEMNDVLQRLKFASAETMNEENQANAIKYEAVYRVYRDIIENYTNAVLRAEEMFYAIKGLEKQVKLNAYGNGDDALKLDEFKKEFSALKVKLDVLMEDAQFIDKQLSAVEPAYQAVVPKVESLIEKNVP